MKSKSICRASPLLVILALCQLCLSDPLAVDSSKLNDEVKSEREAQMGDYYSSGNYYSDQGPVGQGRGPVHPSTLPVPKPICKEWKLACSKQVSNGLTMKASESGTEGPVFEPNGRVTFPGEIINRGQNIIFRGTKSNSWIMHAPDDGRTDLYLAPLKSDQTDWNWGRSLIFSNAGSLTVQGDLTVGNNHVFAGASNNWILHAPQDGRTTFYIAPRTADKKDWNWGVQTRFEADGRVFFQGLPIFAKPAHCNTQRDMMQGGNLVSIGAEDEAVYIIYRDRNGTPRGLRLVGNVMGENCGNIKQI